VTRSSQLHALQVIDLALDRDRARLDEIGRLLDDDHVLAAVRLAREEAERQSRQSSETVRAAEDAVASLQSKLREIEGRLYSGALHNPKELQDLQRDAESVQRHIASLDERLLEAMLKQEEADKALAQAQDLVHQREAESQGARQVLLVEQSRLQTNLERRSPEREAVQAGLPPEDLALYARLRQSLGGVAVTAVEDGACRACGLVLSASGRQEVRSSPAPLRCRQCGRVLYAG
jgi:predicted  nucleic acid-binding Zn-ribbon protein